MEVDQEGRLSVGNKDGAIFVSSGLGEWRGESAGRYVMELS